MRLSVSFSSCLHSSSCVCVSLCVSVAVDHHSDFVLMYCVAITQISIGDLLMNANDALALDGNSELLHPIRGLFKAAARCRQPPAGNSFLHFKGRTPNAASPLTSCALTGRSALKCLPRRHVGPTELLHRGALCWC